MFGKDAPDYGKLKEERRMDREDTKYIESCFKLGIGNSLDKMLDVVSGNYRTPSLPDEPDKITAPIKNPGGGKTRKANNLAAMLRGEDDEAPSQRSASSSKFAEVMEELERFRFSSDSDKRKKQITAVAKAVRAALQNFVPTEVFNNTKKVFGEYVEKGFQINGGVKILFSLGSDKYMVSARGAFYGDEIIGLGKTESGKIKASVNRLTGEGDETDEVSSEFAIDLERQ